MWEDIEIGHRTGAEVLHRFAGQNEVGRRGIQNVEADGSEADRRIAEPVAEDEGLTEKPIAPHGALDEVGRLDENGSVAARGVGRGHDLERHPISAQGGGPDKAPRVADVLDSTEPPERLRGGLNKGGR